MVFIVFVFVCLMSLISFQQLLYLVLPYWLGVMLILLQELINIIMMG